MPPRLTVLVFRRLPAYSRVTVYRQGRYRRKLKYRLPSKNCRHIYYRQTELPSGLCLTVYRQIKTGNCRYRQESTANTGYRQIRVPPTLETARIAPSAVCCAGCRATCGGCCCVGAFFCVSGGCCLHETAQSRCDEQRSSLLACEARTYPTTLPNTGLARVTVYRRRRYRRKTKYRLPCQEITVVLHCRQNIAGIF